MSTGLYPDFITVERFQSSPSAGNIAQTFIAPFDLDVLGLMAHVGTAAGSSDAITINVSDFPTSQQGGSGTTVSAYNLWTATNVPTITDPSQNSFSITNSVQVVENIPYALNYPLPGPSGTVGYKTAQATSTTTQTPVTSPPLVYRFGVNALVAPDNTYTNYNGIALEPASLVHAGDILTFVVGGTVGSAANLEIVLVASKR